jgi:hypothetical protein
MERSNQPPKAECCLQRGQEPNSRGMTEPNDLREAYTGSKRGPQAGLASCLSNSASKGLNADGDGLGMPEPNTDGAVTGQALVGLPGSKSVARAAEAAWNQGDPDRSRRPNYESQAGRGVQRQGEHSEASQGVRFVHSSPWQDARLETSEGTNRLTKSAQATRCRTTDGATLANLPAGDTRRVSLKSPVRANRTPGSVRGAPGNRCPYLDISSFGRRAEEADRLVSFGAISGSLAAIPPLDWAKSLFAPPTG